MKSRLLSGKVKKLTGTRLDGSRYEYLDVSQAEPDLGLPAVDGSVLISLTTGTRIWSNALVINTLTSAVAIGGELNVGGIIRANTLSITTTSYIANSQILTTATVNDFITVIPNQIYENTSSVRVIDNFDSGVEPQILITVANNDTVVYYSTLTEFLERPIVIQGRGLSDFAGIPNNALQVYGGIGAQQLYISGTAYLGGAEILTTQTGVSSELGSLIASLATVLTTTTNSTSTQTGALVVKGGIGVGKDVYIGGTLVFPDNGRIITNQIEVKSTGSNTSSNTGVLLINGGIVTITTTTVSTSSTTGALTVVGGVGIGGDLYVGGIASLPTVTGVVNFTSTASSTSSTSGALRVAGGVGISGDLFVGGNITANQLTIEYTTITTTVIQTDDIIVTLNTSSAISTETGALRIAGGAGIGGDLWVGGRVYSQDAETITTATVNQYANQTSIIAGTDTAVSTSTGNITIWNTSTLESVTGRGNSTTNAISILNNTAAGSTDTGALTVVGGAGIGGDLYVGGKLYQAGLEVITTASVNDFANQTSITAGTDTAVSTSTGNITIWNTSTLQSITNRGNSTTNAIHILNTSDSITSNTGALIVSGGLYVAKNARFDENIYLKGALVLTSATLNAYVATTDIRAGTDTAVSSEISTASNIFYVWNTSTLQTITNRGNSTTNAIRILNTSNSALNVAGGVVFGSTLNIASTLTFKEGSSIDETPAGATTVTLDQLEDITNWAGTLVFTRQDATTYQALPDGPTISFDTSTWILGYDSTLWFSSTDLVTWVAGPYAGTTPPVGTLSTGSTNLTVNGNTWAFGTDGNLVLPNGGIIKEFLQNDLIITVIPGTGSNSSGNLGHGVDQSPAGQWSDNTTYPPGTLCRLTLVGTTGDWIQYNNVILYTQINNGTNIVLCTDPDYTQTIDVTTGTFSTGTLTLLSSGVAIQSGPSTWNFAADGTLTAPGDIYVQSTSSSTSTDTGALTVVGGVGIGENLYVKGIISAEGGFQGLDAKRIFETTSSVTVSDTGTVGKVTVTIANNTNTVFSGNKVKFFTPIEFANSGTIADTTSSLVLTPPGALAGQSLVLRGTSPTGITSDHPGGFAPGDTITITVIPDNNNQVTGTIDYTFTGCTEVQLGRALTGTLTFTSQSSQTVTWTVPALSSMTTFTFTLSNPSGIGLAGITTLTLTGTGSSEASHIHLISGNPTTVDLYLGDDDQYVKIVKNAGGVIVGTNSSTNRWIFDPSGNLTAPGDIYVQSTASSTSTNSGALTVVGGVGIGGDLYVGNSLVFPDNLKIANSVISNQVIDLGGDLVAGSEIKVSLSTTTIINKVMNSLGGGGAPPSLTAQSQVAVDASKVVIARQVINDDGASTTLTAQNQIEVNSNGILIGYKIVETTTGTTTSTFSGWTFSSTGNLTASSTASSTSTTTGALVVAGGVGIGGDLYIGGDIYTKDQKVITTATVNQFANQTSITAGTDTAVSTSTGNIVIWNTSTLQSVSDRGNSTTNALLVLNTTSAVSTDTGALTVVGGVGVGGELYVGGKIYSETAEVLTTATVNDFANQTSITAGTDTAVSASSGSITVWNTSTLESVTGRGNSTTKGITIIGDFGFNGTTSTFNSTLLFDNSYNDIARGPNKIKLYDDGSWISGIGVSYKSVDIYSGKDTNFYQGAGPDTNNVGYLTLSISSSSVVINATSATVSTTTGALVVSGGVGIGGDLWVGGKLYANNLEVVTTATVDQALNQTLQTITDKGFTTTNQINVLNTSEAISITTAAFVVSGGVSIGLDLRVGGSLYVNNLEVVTTGTVDQALNQTLQSITEKGFTTTTRINVLNTVSSTATVTENALYVAGGVGIGQSLYVTGKTFFQDDVTFAGNSTFIFSTNTFYTDNLIELHVPGSVYNDWTVNDGKDIGLRFHYYRTFGGDTNAALVLSPTTGYLTWYGTGAETDTGVFSTATYGSFKTGEIEIANSTTSFSTNTGALRVVGGVGIGGDLYVGGNIYGVSTGSTFSGTANAATNIVGGAQYQIPFQSTTGTTNFDNKLRWISASSTLAIGTPNDPVGSLTVENNVTVGGVLNVSRIRAIDTSSIYFLASGIYNTATSTSSHFWSFGSDGRTNFPNYSFPAEDGPYGFALVTNGTGTVSWSPVLSYVGSIGYTGSSSGFTGSTGYWGSIGDIGYTGSIGYSGSEGIGFTGSSSGYIGSFGYTGSVGYTGSQGAGYTGSKGFIGSEGYTGSQGAGFSGSQGIVGYIGSTGLTGFVGSRGVDGTSVRILGSVTNTTDLPGWQYTYTGAIGDGYIVTSSGHLWVWSGTMWVDAGLISGPQGERGFIGSSGAGFVGSSAPGYVGSVGYQGSKGALDPWTKIVANYSASNNQRLIADTSAGQFTVALPDSPTIGSYLIITDGYSWSTIPLLVTASIGTTIEGYGETLQLDITGITVEFIWSGATWQVTATLGVRGSGGYTGSMGAFAALGFTGSQAGLTTVQSDILPATSSTYALGAVGKGWTSVYANFGYIGSNLYVGNETVDSLTVSKTLIISTSTMYLGGNTININSQGTLLLNNAQVGVSVAQATVLAAAMSVVLGM